MSLLWNTELSTDVPLSQFVFLNVTCLTALSYLHSVWEMTLNGFALFKENVIRLIFKAVSVMMYDSEIDKS